MTYSPTKKEDVLLFLIDNYNYITSYSYTLLLEKGNASRYLKKLQAVGYINYVDITAKGLCRYDQKNIKAWHLTDNGKSYIKFKRGRYLNNFRPEKIKPALLNHTVKCTNFEIYLYKYHGDIIDFYYPDRYLHQKMKHEAARIRRYTGGLFRTPDAFFQTKKNGKERTFAVEVELSKKAKDRYFNIWNYYKEFGYYSHVFWLYDDEKIKNFVADNFYTYYQFDLQQAVDTGNKNLGARLEHLITTSHFLKRELFYQSGLNSQEAESFSSLFKTR